MHIYLVCFDITEDKSRNKIGLILGRYGDRVQLSTFEISLKNTVALKQLLKEIKPLVELGDSLRFYHLCQNCREKSHDHSGQSIASFPAAIVI